MADPSMFRLSRGPFGPICAAHNKFRRQSNSAPTPVIVMLSFIVYFARRKRAYVWSPALDLRDPHVAAALVPMINS